MNSLYKIISFYCFSSIEKSELLNLKKELLVYENNGISGLMILAEEGVNATICGDEKFVNLFYKEIKKLLKNADLNEKISFSEKRIFKKLKIKIKSEIVTMGIKDINPELESGTYLDAEGWNSLLNDEKTLVIDTRNHYEVSLGTFEHAINPKLNNFREFPDWLENNLKILIKNNEKINVAMFCTGGIRCEKATSLLRQKGFENVYHLKGGILKYLENVSSVNNLYKGECYVFDERVTIDNNLEKGSYSICHACGMPLSIEDKKKLLYVKGIQCHWCIDKFTDSDRARFAERQKQIEDKAKKKNFSAS